mgnify:CR=1 FL=1
MTINGRTSDRTVIENEAMRRRSITRREMEQRKERLSSLCPRALEIQKEMKAVTVDIANKVTEAPGDAPQLMKLLEGILARKREEYAAALADVGLEADYLEQVYFCSECKDTGYVKNKPCKCMQQTMIVARFACSGVNPDQNFESFRFDLLDDAKQQRIIKNIYDYCRSYAESFPDNERKDMVLIGPPGVGKSFLLNCIGGSVLSRGFSVLKLTANRLIQNILDNLHNSAAERIDFTLPDLLIIDDLGTEPMVNNITVESLLNIISDRQEAGRATLLATNLGTAQLAEEYGGRILSRIILSNSSKVITIETADVRRKR